MKYIKKSKTPNILIEWIQKNKQDINFGYDLLRQDKNAMDIVSKNLLQEQFFLCAYTGLSIDNSTFHIEHLKPQKHCNKGEDVDYKNLLACYPEPNRSKVPYGAHKKGDWPPPQEEKYFVSPLNLTCETKFQFDRNGKIFGVDESANKTINKLGLAHSELEGLRKSSLLPLLKLKRSEASRRLYKIMTPVNRKLEEFCFVKKQILEKQIKKLEAIIQENKSKF
ncbi:MAG: hypothetical protein H7A23_17520 [Leptospiraceae bacterium]|nr:hypothetical protein [Leptospiraceae bacterium]MCP5496349.1 hypothetical protein [Leptospiraceae bacterium]